MTRTVKVAIVGSGLAGLTAAYRLSKTPRVKDVEFEVHLFEKSNSLGLDSHSVSLGIPEYNGEYRVNVPMRSFQGGYYPQLIALYEHLGVQFREADFSYSFSTLFQPPPVKRRSSSETQTRRITSTMIYNGKSGREGVGIPSSFFPPLDTTSQSSLIPFLGFVVSRIQAYTLFAVSTILLLGFYLALVFHSLPLHVNIPRTVTVRSVSGASIHLPFPKDIFSFIPRRPPRHTTLREWTELTTPKGYLARRFGLDQRWREFVSGVMVLLFSAVCTASEEMIWDMPVEEVLDYIYLTLGTHHYVVQNGVREVARKLTEWIPSKQIHLSTSIVSLSLSPESQKSSRLRRARRTVDVHCAGNQVFEGFDHVILATQANQAGPLLSTYVDSLPISPSDPPAPQTDSDSSFMGDEAVKNPNTREDDDDEEEREALRIHSEYIQSQLSCLSEFSYCPTIVVNHTDSTLLPADSRDWRDLNLVVCPSPPSPSPDTPTSEKGTGDEDEEKRLVVPFSYTMATYLLPPPAGYSHLPIPGTLRSTSSPSHIQIRIKEKEKLKSFPRVYQTTNPIVAPRQETIMSVARLERPIIDVKSKRALRGLWKERLQDDSLVTINDEGEELDEEDKTFGWRWGTSGSDGGALGCLQGAGKVLPLPPDSEDTEREKDGVERKVIQDVPGIWICGSYAHAGIPLLEGCVVSARNVVEQGIWVCEGVDEREVDKLW